MATSDLIVDKTLDLSPEQQDRVLEFVEALRREARSPHPRKSLRGLLSGFDVSPEDIDEARRELWSSFPRPDVP